MKVLVHLLVLAGLLPLLPVPVARAVLTEHATTNRYLAVTNTLPATEVRPLAAYVLFPTPATGSVSVLRVSGGVPIPLARFAFTNALALTWLPPADFPIRRGEALAVSSTVARFSVQLETGTDSAGVLRADAPPWYADGQAPVAQAGASLSVTSSTSVVVTNAPQFVVTNAPVFVLTNAPVFVITNNVIVGESAAGPQFVAGMEGEYIATNWLDLSGYHLTARHADGTPGPVSVLGRPAGSGFAGGVVQIKGGTGGGGSSEEGGAVLIEGGSGPADGVNPPGVVIVHGGDGQGSIDYAGATLTLRGGNGSAGTGSSGADVILAGGTGIAQDGRVVIVGNNAHGTASAGILLDLQNAELRVQSDTMTVSTGASEEVVVSDGAGGFITLRFSRGIYIGHTGP